MVQRQHPAQPSVLQRQLSEPTLVTCIPRIRTPPSLSHCSASRTGQESGWATEFAAAPAPAAAMAATAQASFVSTSAALGASSSVARTGDPGASARLQLAARAPAPQLRASRRQSLVARAAVAGLDMDALLEQVKSLTLAEAKVFTDRLSEDLGISALSFAPASGAGPAAGGAATEAAAAVEEKTEFDLTLEAVPSAARIAVIKAVRTLTALGLKEAKDMIEALPKKVKEGVSKEDAEEAKKALEAAGATCSIA